MTVTEDPAITRAGEEAPVEPPRPLRAAVFGLGRAGLQHAAVLSTLANVELVAIGDPERAARRNARGMGLAARAFADLDALLRHAAPEALVVATPFDLKASVVARALEAGAAVQMEGAPALPASDLAVLLRQAGQGRAVACALPLAHYPVFAAVRRVAASGTLGKIREVRASRSVSRVFSPAQQRAYAERGASRGVIAHTGMELVFLLVQMFGAPRELKATASRVYGTMEDEARGTWTLDGQARIAFEVSWSTPGFPRPATVIEIEAEAGRLLVSEDAMELDLVAAREDYPAGVTRLGRADVLPLARFDLDGDARWLEDTAFVAWAAGGSEPVTRLAAVLEAARVIDALYASAESGGRPVEVGRLEFRGPGEPAVPPEVGR